MCPAEDIYVDDHPDRDVTVLLVEDETLVRIATAEHLRDAGFTVIEAVTGDEARAVLEAGVPVQLVLTDVNMPGSMDGIALAEWVGAQKDPPLVMVTSGVPVMLDQARARCPHVRAFLQKPYDHDAVERSIRVLLPRAGETI